MLYTNSYNSQLNYIGYKHVHKIFKNIIKQVYKCPHIQYLPLLILLRNVSYTADIYILQCVCSIAYNQHLRIQLYVIELGIISKNNYETKNIVLTCTKPTLLYWWINPRYNPVLTVLGIRILSIARLAEQCATSQMQFFCTIQRSQTAFRFHCAVVHCRTIATAAIIAIWSIMFC